MYERSGDCERFILQSRNECRVKQQRKSGGQSAKERRETGLISRRLVQRYVGLRCIAFGR